MAELFKDALSGANMSLSGLEKYVEINGKRYTKIELDDYVKKVGLVNGLAGIADDYADGQSFGHTVVGAAVDFGLIAITKFIPVVGWITLWYDIGNLLDKLDGKDSGIFDLRKQAQNLWDKIMGDYKDDVLFGEYGDDTLMGKGGGDLLIGGYGNDGRNYKSLQRV